MKPVSSELCLKAGVALGLRARLELLRDARRGRDAHSMRTPAPLPS